MEDSITNLTNTDDDTKILLLTKLEETKEAICDSFCKQHHEKEQECKQIKKEYIELPILKEKNADETKENKINNMEVKYGPAVGNNNKKKNEDKKANESCQRLLLDDLVR